MKKKRLMIRDKRLREKISYKKREDFKKDFFELLKRAGKTINLHS